MTTLTSTDKASSDLRIEAAAATGVFGVPTAVVGFFCAVAVVVLLGALSSVVYSKAVAALGAVETALWTATVPAVTTLLAGFVLDETPTALALVGVVMVSAGMAISARGRKQAGHVRGHEHRRVMLTEEERSWWGQS